MRAVDIGTTRVVQLNESSSIKDAARTMKRHDVGCVVVVKSTLLGLVPSGITTDRDLAIRLLSDDCEENKYLGDIASAPLVICRPDTTLDELVNIMLGSHVRRLPIVDEEGELTGIVCLDDVVAALAELLDRVSRTSTGNRSID